MREGRISWTCFHCDESFTDARCARLHFGVDEGSTPACRIEGSEGGLVEALREAQQDAANAWDALHNETTDVHRAYYAATSRFRTALRAAEETGFARGMADERECVADWLEDQARKFDRSDASLAETLRRLVSEVRDGEHHPPPATQSEGKAA